jgi:hypothetical protein
MDYEYIRHFHANMKLFRMFYRMILHIKQPGMDGKIYSFILSPFTSRLWLSLLVIMMFLTIAVYATWSVGMKHETQRARNPTENLSQSALYVIGSFCMQGEQSAFLRTLCG